MKVEKGVPLPSKYPFAGMQIGDSFAVPNEVKRQAVSVAAHSYGKEHGQKFTVRLMPDRTLRCWRIA
jgi:hypothetical protein